MDEPIDRFCTMLAKWPTTSQKEATKECCFALGWGHYSNERIDNIEPERIYWPEL